MLIALTLLAQSALASPQISGPSDPPPSTMSSILGDWDLGPNTSALRISEKDSQNLFVQFCDRDTLVNTHVCNATVIIYFGFSASGQDFTHTDTGGQHLNATLQLDPKDPTVIYYDFTSDVGSGNFTGKKL